jgi:hypothetical protein
LVLNLVVSLIFDEMLTVPTQVATIPGTLFADGSDLSQLFCRPFEARGAVEA